MANVALIAILYSRQNSTFRRLALRSSSMDSTESSSSEASNQEFRTSNMILIASIVMYSITCAPMVVFKCLELASRWPLCIRQLSLTEVNAIPVINTALLTNYSLNFAIYILFGRKFRNRLIQSINKVVRRTNVTTLPSPRYYQQCPVTLQQPHSLK